MISPRSTNRVRTLGDRGFVTRTQDTGDRRRHMLAITPEGQKVIDDKHDEATRIAQRLRSTLGEEKFETLLDLLSALDDFRA